MKYIGAMNSKVKDIEENLLGIFRDKIKYMQENVRFDNNSFYFHDSISLGFSKDRKLKRTQKEKAGKTKALEFIESKFPQNSSYNPNFKFDNFHLQFGKDNYLPGDKLTGGNFLKLCRAYLQEYKNKIENSFKRKAEVVLKQMFQIYKQNHIFVLGHEHSHNKSPAFSFLKDFFIYIRDQKNIDISKGHALWYEKLMTLHNSYQRRNTIYTGEDGAQYKPVQNGKNTTYVKDDTEFKPIKNYQNPNRLDNHLDFLQKYSPSSYSVGKWFVDSRVRTLFYDDCLTSGVMILQPGADPVPWDPKINTQKFKDDLEIKRILCNLDDLPEAGYKLHDVYSNAMENLALRIKLNNVIASRIYNDAYNTAKTFVPIGDVHVEIPKGYGIHATPLQDYLKSNLAKYGKRTVALIVKTGETPDFELVNQNGITANIVWPPWG
ncbi:MAG: hypothetical protein GY750_15235 [Lentisphaerae bacterium]|nr:hypothetical protein [Lentisphaerota bacterium]MCP4102751.1 hypothetical protein [Lentisphaerota bacterium]